MAKMAIVTGWAEGQRVGLLLLLLGLEVVLAAVPALSPPARVAGGGSDEANRRLVLELQLTDLALFSDASYCRHPSQADLFSPHADHPAAMEHFPAGSIVPPRRGPGDP